MSLSCQEDQRKCVRALLLLSENWRLILTRGMASSDGWGRDTVTCLSITNDLQVDLREIKSYLCFNFLRSQRAIFLILQEVVSKA